MTPNKTKLYLIYGLLLGNSLIMKNNSDIKLIIEIECKYTTFLTEVYNKIFSLVDCDNKLTVIKTKLCKGGQLNKVMFLHTYSNNHYLELYNKWYKNKSNKNIPLDIMNYFNEVSLAYWLMTDGKIKNRKLSVNMNKFKKKEIIIFKQQLETKFQLDQIILNNNWLEFNFNNIKKIYILTKPYILSSMKFKFIF